MINTFNKSILYVCTMINKIYHALLRDKYMYTCQSAFKCITDLKWHIDHCECCLYRYCRNFLSI